MTHVSLTHHRTLIISLGLFLISPSFLFGARELRVKKSNNDTLAEKTQAIPIPYSNANKRPHYSFQLRSRELPYSLTPDSLTPSAYESTVAFSWKQAVCLLGKVHDYNSVVKLNHEEYDEDQESNASSNTNEEYSDEYSAYPEDDKNQENEENYVVESSIDSLALQLNKATPQELFNLEYRLKLLRNLAEAITDAEEDAKAP